MKILKSLLLCLLMAAPHAPVLAANRPAATRPTVAVQPLGKLDRRLVDAVLRGIESMYNVDVIILPVTAMPAATYYKPTRRYRAEKILSCLDRTVASKYTKIVGLTAQAISITKGRYYDWSISGLGAIGHRPSVVSSHGLRKRNTSNALFLKRLVKVTNHEIGHTFGLRHCPDKRCLMADMKASLHTLDSRTGALCARCQMKLGAVLR